MITAISAIIGLIVRLITMWIDKYNKDVELKQDWIKFMSKMQERGNISPALRKSFIYQIESLQKKLDEEKKNP